MIKTLSAICLLCLPAVAIHAEEYAAVLDWSQRVVLSTPVSGVVTRVEVRPGIAVRTGQLLVQLDQRPFDNVLQKRRESMHKFKLQRDEAQRELERTRELYDRTVISAHDLQLAEIAAASAQADYASATAAVQAVELQLEFSNLRAPFDGIVLAVDAAPGMTVVNSLQVTPLVTLAGNHPMHVRVQVPDALMEGLGEDRRASVVLDGKRYAAVPAWRGVEPDSNGNFTLMFAFDPGNARVHAGQPAKLELD